MIALRFLPSRWDNLAWVLYELKYRFDIHIIISEEPFVVGIISFSSPSVGKHVVPFQKALNKCFSFPNSQHSNANFWVVAMI